MAAAPALPLGSPSPSTGAVPARPPVYPSPHTQSRRPVAGRLFLSKVLRRCAARSTPAGGSHSFKSPQGGAVRPAGQAQIRAPIYSRCGGRDIVWKQRTMLTRQRCGGGHAGRRFLGYSSKASLVRRCIALGQTAASGLCRYQPTRGGAHRGCSESRDLRQRQLSADAVRPPCSRLTAIGQHAGSGPRAFVRVDRPPNHSPHLLDSPAGFLESWRG
jgi:hypothetical protein